MQENGHRLSGKTIIGIDPAKNKHQAIVLSPDGSVCGRSFSFQTNHTGFTKTLPRRIRERIKCEACGPLRFRIPKTATRSIDV